MNLKKNFIEKIQFEKKLFYKGSGSGSFLEVEVLQKKLPEVEVGVEVVFKKYSEVEVEVGVVNLQVGNTVCKHIHRL